MIPASSFLLGRIPNPEHHEVWVNNAIRHAYRTKTTILFACSLILHYMNHQLVQLFRFGIVGCTGILIDFTVTWFCKEVFKQKKLLANAIGFSVAVVSNFLLNRRWTYASHDTHIWKQFCCFILVSLVGLGINTAILYFLHDKKKIPFYLSKLMATFFVFCWNFGANTFLTFKNG